MKKLGCCCIYKIIYPNGKIYIGQDRTNDVNYFGSADSFTIAADFTRSQRQCFTVTKVILAEYDDITIQELNEMEKRFISEYRSNNPDVGYNRTNCPRRRCKTIYQEDT